MFGAGLGGVIALISLVALFLNDAYLPGVYGVAIVFLVLYFGLPGGTSWSSPRKRNSP